MRSPSRSAGTAVTVSVWPTVGLAGARLAVTVGGELTTVVALETVAPFKIPLFGVTATLIVLPLSPLPATPRSSVSVRLAVFDVVLTTVPFFVQTYVSVTGLPLGSLAVAVAVSTALVVVAPAGPFDERATVAE